MGIVNDWQKKLRVMMESPFPQFEEPPVANTLGGINQASKLGEPVEAIPTIDVNDETNHCNIECDALVEIIIWAGADTAEADKVVEKIKTLNKQKGVLSTEDLGEVLNQPDQPTPANGLTTVIPVAPTGLASGRQMAYNESLEKVMNDEDVEIIGKKKEDKK